MISVILKVRDENILKTGLGGDYLVSNYFMRVKDIGKKRKVLKRELDPENAEWNELKVLRVADEYAKLNVLNWSPS